MSQVQVKQVIASLCTLLEHLTASHVTPEDFRLAKFNEINVVETMWRLAFKLLAVSKNRSSLNKEANQNKLFLPSRLVDYRSCPLFVEMSQPNRLFCILCSKGQIRNIKKEFRDLGYNSSEFLSLSESSLSEPNSSRHILLAIGWLISTQRVIEVILSDVVSSNEEYFTWTHQKFETIDNMKTQWKDNETKNDAIGQLNYFKWMQGHFKFKLNSIYATDQEKARLTYKLHNLSENAHVRLQGKHLSCYHLYLLKHSNELERFGEELKRKNEFLTKAQVWLQHEDIFWTWMESVLDEQLDSEGVNSAHDYSENYTPNTGEPNYAAEFHEAYAAERHFAEEFNKLKSLVQNIDIEQNIDDIEAFSNENHHQLANFAKELEHKLEQVVISNKSWQSEAPTKDVRLILKPRAKSESNLQPNRLLICKIIEQLELESKLFALLCKREYADLVKNCQEISNQLKDSVVIFNE